jgi:WD40 repeat protein
MTFSPGGNTLYAIATQPARTNLYAIDVVRRTARLLGSWPGLVPPAPSASASVAVAPGGKNLAVTLATASPASLTPVAERLVLLDASSGSTLWKRHYPMHTGQWEAHAAFAPDGKLLTSAEQGDTLVWNTRTGRVVRRYPIGGRFAVSADGSRAAVALNSPSPAIPNSSISILNLRSGATHSLAARVPDAWLVTLSFTPDGRRVVGADFQGDVFVWDVATGAIAETYSSQPGARLVSVLSHDGSTVFSGAEDGSVVAYDLAGGRRLGSLFQWNTPDKSCASAPCMVVNAQSKVMAADQGDGTTALVDLQTLRPTATLPARNGPVPTRWRSSRTGASCLREELRAI